MKISIYARVSTEKQEKEETVNSQLDALRDYAQKNNYDIYKEYIDEGYSGELLDRPALDKLRDDAKNRLFDIVLVHSPDRLSRKFLYLGIVQEELKKYGINIVFLNRPDSKDTPEDNLLNGVQGLIAEYEKAKILERTRRGKLHKARNNLLVGSIAPYGYRYLKKDSTNASGCYEVLEKEAKVVKTIFDLFVNKRLSIRTIAKELTRKAIKPRKGLHWRTSTIHKILRNETYTGITYYNKNISFETDNHKNGSKYRRAKNTGRRLRPTDQWIRITLPDKLKIIDKSMFALAQKQLKRNSELSPRNVKNQYLLRGLVSCGKCDSPFYGTPYHKELFYRCGNRHRTFPLPKECNAASVKADILEGVVWNKFCDAIYHPRLIAEQVVKLQDKAEQDRGSITEEIDSIEKQLKDAEGEENRLLDAYRENIIPMEKLKEQMEIIQNKKKRLEEEKMVLIDKQGSSFSPILIKKTVNDYCRLIERRLDSLKSNFEGKRYLLSLALNKIILDDKKVIIKGIIPLYPYESPISKDIVSTTY